MHVQSSQLQWFLSQAGCHNSAESTYPTGSSLRPSFHFQDSLSVSSRKTIGTTVRCESSVGWRFDQRNPNRRGMPWLVQTGGPLRVNSGRLHRLGSWSLWWIFVLSLWVVCGIADQSKFWMDNDLGNVESKLTKIPKNCNILLVVTWNAHRSNPCVSTSELSKPWIIASHL